MRSKVLRYTLHTIDTSAMLQSSSGRAQKPATKFAKKRARHSLSSSSTGLETMPKSPGHQTNLCQQEQVHKQIKNCSESWEGTNQQLRPSQSKAPGLSLNRAWGSGQRCGWGTQVNVVRVIKAHQCTPVLTGLRNKNSETKGSKNKCNKGFLT